MSRFIHGALILSVVGHAAFLAYGAPRPRVNGSIDQRFGLATMVATQKLVDKHQARVLRKALIDAAKAARSKGTLRLGQFLIAANRIDADEDGQSFDDEEALVQYENRLSELRKVLRDESVVAYAAPEVFSDLRYYGRPGGRMGDALLDGGGSCEQLAQLVVATAYDVGRGKDVAFRAYGKPGPDGAGHLAPIAKHEGVEYDLMTGAPAAQGGVRVAPDEIIDVYARVHGLAPMLEGATSKKTNKPSEKFGGEKGEPSSAANLEPDRKSLAAGFPPNDDAFPGSLPLYAERALKPPGFGGTMEEGPVDAEAAIERARHCAYFVRMAALSPLVVDVVSDENARQDEHSFEVVRIPNASRLEREARLLRAAEDLARNKSVGDADHLLGYACLAALGDMAAVDFSLARERRLSALALDTSKRAREMGKQLLREIPWKTPDGAELSRQLRVDFAGRFWLLLFLEGSEEIVLDLVRQGDADDWGRISSAAALLLFPKTRARAFDSVGKFSRRDQVDVMHEIFHAHDHLRPWATNYELELPPEASASAVTFYQVYRVFRAMAFRLWEGQREPRETVDQFLEEAREAGLEDAWQAALIDYYARNVLALYSRRNKGLEIMEALDRAIQTNRHPSLEPLRRQIAYIKAEGKLDARTLADAFRQK
jgi:hypothetical protein